MPIKEYEDRYRDDIIFTVLPVKDALHSLPIIDPDLSAIRANCFDKNGLFRPAADGLFLRRIDSIPFHSCTDST